MLRFFLRPRWLLATVLVIGGAVFTFRMGLWQLDRLAQRRAFNERVLAQIAAERLDLNVDLPSDLYEMEYRKVTVRGRYDFSQEVLLRNQVWENRLGFRVLTPLQIEGRAEAVLVDRGWIPYEQSAPELRSAFAETGLVTVNGVLRRPQSQPDFGGIADPTLSPGQNRLDAWNIVNLERIQQQVNLPLLPMYVQQAADEAWVGPPYRSLALPEISEGSHLGYAIQWFSFSVLLLVGFPFYLRRVSKQDKP
jgi:surfeit locus 1 family protein